MIDENNNKVDEPYDPTLGITVYIKHMEECQQLATDAGDAFTDMQLVRKGQLAMAKSGLFEDYYREWLRKPRNQQTWVDFKTFWTNAINEWEELNKLTSKGTNFGANAATYEESTNNLELALDNLAMAAATDKSTIEKLTETNKKLTAQLESTIATIQRLTEDNQRLLRMIDKNIPTTNPYSKKMKNWEDDSLFDPEGYCWSHGFKCRKGHTSATCTTPRMGHKREAT